MPVHIREADLLENGYVCRGIQVIILDDEFVAILQKRVLDRSSLSKFAAGSFHEAVFAGIAKAVRLLGGVVVYSNEPASRLRLR